MATKKELLEKLDKIDDEDLAHMLALVAYRESQEELDQLLQSEEYTPPDEMEMRTFQEKFHKNSQRALHRSKSRMIRWACGVAAAAVFAFAVPISADNVTIFQLVAQVFTDYSDISTLDGYTFEKPAEWDCEYYPTWIPDTFHYSGIIQQSNSQALHFESSTGESFSFSYMTNWISYYGAVEHSMIVNGEITLHEETIPIYSDQNGINKTVYIPVKNGFVTIDGELTYRQLSKIIKGTYNFN